MHHIKKAEINASNICLKYFYSIIYIIAFSVGYFGSIFSVVHPIIIQNGGARAAFLVGCLRTLIYGYVGLKRRL